MSAATLIPMAKIGRPPKEEPSEPVRIPRSTLRRVRRMAAHLEMDPGDYIALRLAKHLDKDEREMAQTITRRESDD